MLEKTFRDILKMNKDS